MSKYIDIVEVGTSGSGKTKVWEVRSSKRPTAKFKTQIQDFSPGIIKWSGAWRKYVYYTNDAFYDWECLRMIADFIETATKEHLA